MTSNYFAERLKEVLTEGKWVTGSNFKEQIVDMDWQDATTSIDGLNSVAQLTFHILYYIKGVTQVFEGGSLDIHDKYSFDGPAITSETAWVALVNDYCTSSEYFIECVAAFPDNRLKDDFAGEKYGSYQRNLDAMIEHCYYHFGQVLLIKKLVAQRK